MTREEAIKIIDCYDINFYDLSGEKIPAYKLAEAFDMAIEALSQPIVCKDYCIDDDHIYCSPKVAEGVVEALSADAVQGEWIGYNADKEDWLRTDGTPIFLVCDKCHGTVINNGSAHWNFCPNCGARMTPYKGGDTE